MLVLWFTVVKIIIGTACMFKIGINTGKVGCLSRFQSRSFAITFTFARPRAQCAARLLSRMTTITVLFSFSFSFLLASTFLSAAYVRLSYECFR